MFIGKGQGLKLEGIFEDARQTGNNEWGQVPVEAAEDMIRAPWHRRGAALQGAEKREERPPEEAEGVGVGGQRTHMGGPLFFHLKEGQWEAGVLRKETKFRVTVLMKNVFGHGPWMKSLFSCNKAQLASRVCDFLQARQGNLAQAYTEQREGPRKPHRDIDKQLGSEDRCVFNPWLCHCLIMKSCLVSTLRHICKKGNITSSNRFGCRMRMWSQL